MTAFQGVSLCVRLPNNATGDLHSFPSQTKHFLCWCGIKSPELIWRETGGYNTVIRLFTGTRTPYIPSFPWSFCAHLWLLGASKSWKTTLAYSTRYPHVAWSYFWLCDLDLKTRLYFHSHGLVNASMILSNQRPTLNEWTRATGHSRHLTPDWKSTRRKPTLLNKGWLYWDATKSG